MNSFQFLVMPSFRKSFRSVLAVTIQTLAFLMVLACLPLCNSGSTVLAFGRPSIYPGMEFRWDHPDHFTTGELIYNEKEKSFQCVVCLHEESLKRALKLHADVNHVSIDNVKQCEPILKSYVADRFLLKDTKGKTVSAKWAGYEADIEGVWIYFEYPMAKPPKGYHIENYLLSRVDPATTGFMVAKWGWRKQFLTFVPGQKKHQLTFVFEKLKKEQLRHFRHQHGAPPVVLSDSLPTYDPPPVPNLRKNQKKQ